MAIKINSEMRECVRAETNGRPAWWVGGQFICCSERNSLPGMHRSLTTWTALTFSIFAALKLLLIKNDPDMSHDPDMSLNYVRQVNTC